MIDIAVVGATGLVGEALLDILTDSRLAVGKVHALASARSKGKTVSYGSGELVVSDLAEFDFSQVKLALFSAGASVSRAYAPKAVAAGAWVVDNTSEFRYDDAIPLVVPEANGGLLDDCSEPCIIANPNCSTIQMLVAIAPIHRAVGIERINVATYQSISGAGREATEDLKVACQRVLNGASADADADGAKSVAFNPVPHIGDFEANGYTKEEMKMVWETRKILGDQDIMVNPTTVRVPVFCGHSEAVHLETRTKITVPEVQKLLNSAAGVELMDGHAVGSYPTATDAAGKDPVYVGRIREDISHPRGLDLWIVADNLRKGAALNSVQIAEKLAARYW